MEIFISIIGGLGIGLLGSFHCVGMCGPIALVLPIRSDSKIERLFLIVLYNLGRATSYALLGLILGFVGNKFIAFGSQRVFTISIGILLLIYFIGSKYFKFKLPYFSQFNYKIKAKISQFLHSSPSPQNLFGVGIVNGLLPCGLVYLALGSALSLGNPLYSAALMIMFGLGTFPLMMSVMLFHKMIPISIRSKFQKMVPIFVLFTISLIILRGLNLGIPYLSPHIETHKSEPQTIECHPSKSSINKGK